MRSVFVFQSKIRLFSSPRDQCYHSQGVPEKWVRFLQNKGALSVCRSQVHLCPISEVTYCQNYQQMSCFPLCDNCKTLLFNVLVTLLQSHSALREYCRVYNNSKICDILSKSSAFNEKYPLKFAMLPATLTHMLYVLETSMYIWEEL